MTRKIVILVVLLNWASGLCPAPERTGGAKESPEDVYRKCQALDKEIVAAQAELKTTTHDVGRVTKALANYEYVKMRNAETIRGLEERVERGPDPLPLHWRPQARRR